MNKSVKQFFEIYKNYDLEERKCIVCGATEKIHDHHIDYIEDITVPLCDKCHWKAHRKGIDNIPAPKDPFKGMYTQSDKYLRKPTIEGHKKRREEVWDELKKITLIKNRNDKFFSEFQELRRDIGVLDIVFDEYEQELNRYVNHSLEYCILHELKTPKITNIQYNQITKLEQDILELLQELVGTCDELHNKLNEVKQKEINQPLWEKYERSK